MKPPQSPPPGPCPVCQVAMHAEETERSLVYECPHCGVVIQSPGRLGLKASAAEMPAKGQ